MLPLFDAILTILHLAIIGFNLFGWIPVITRKAHLVSVLLTAGSWLLLGIWFGIGYCPLTDWQWRVKEKLGEQYLPSNFIEYFSEKISGHDFDSQFINHSTAICFIIVALISLYLNLIRNRGTKTATNR